MNNRCIFFCHFPPWDSTQFNGKHWRSNPKVPTKEWFSFWFFQLTKKLQSDLGAFSLFQLTLHLVNLAFISSESSESSWLLSIIIEWTELLSCSSISSTRYLFQMFYHCHNLLITTSIERSKLSNGIDRLGSSNWKLVRLDYKRKENLRDSFYSKQNCIISPTQSYLYISNKWSIVVDMTSPIHIYLLLLYSCTWEVFQVVVSGCYIMYMHHYSVWIYTLLYDSKAISRSHFSLNNKYQFNLHQLSVSYSITILCFWKTQLHKEVYLISIHQ